MKIPLVYGENNPKYKFLDSIFIIINSLETKQELARNNLRPIKTIINTINIRFISMFFNSDTKYLINKINNSSRIRKQWRTNSKLDYNKISKTFISL